MTNSNTFDLSRLSLNTATAKHATLAEAVDVAARAGYGAIGAWRDRVQEVGAEKAAKIISDAGLRVSSLCRGGFFTTPDSDKIANALDDNKRAIEEAATIGTKELVMVVGGLPANPAPGEPVSPTAGDAERDVVAARARIGERLADLADFAKDHGVRMVLEPMHPIFAADRGCICTIGQALEIAAPFDPEVVGVVADTYHIWWDPQLRESIERCGKEGRLAGYQICDWVLPLQEDTLNSRGYVGDGYIDFKTITEWIDATGYSGDIETEIFNTQIWAHPTEEIVAHVGDDYGRLVLPYLSK